MKTKQRVEENSVTALWVVKTSYRDLYDDLNNNTYCTTFDNPVFCYEIYEGKKIQSDKEKKKKKKKTLGRLLHLSLNPILNIFWFRGNLVTLCTNFTLFQNLCEREILHRLVISCCQYCTPDLSYLILRRGRERVEFCNNFI